MLFIDWCSQNGERGVQLLSEWTGIDADGYKVDINLVSKGSGKKVKWRCKEGHVWNATLNNRTSSKANCPECYKANAPKMTAKSRAKRSITLLEWCNKNGERGKQLLSEWTGITETGGIFDSPADIASQSNKKLEWKCSKGHTWMTKVQKRTLLGSDCPYCANQKIAPGENDLYTWCINNNKQYLIDEWLGIDEFGNSIKMQDVAKSTHKRVYWRHYLGEEEHTWLAAISDRTARSSRCPMCHGMNNLKPGINDLETWCKNNPELGEELKKQWVGKTKSGENIKLSEISYGSHTVVAWKCNCGNIWYDTPLRRIYYKSKVCPDCSKLKANEIRMKKVLDNSTTLLDWCKQNEIYGDKLIKEWVGLDEYGNSVDINEVTCYSTRKVKWRHTTKKEKNTNGCAEYKVE